MRGEVGADQDEVGVEILGYLDARPTYLNPDVGDSVSAC